MIIIEYLILLLPILIEVPTDAYRILKHKKEDNHKEDIPVRGVFMILAGLISMLFFAGEFNSTPIEQFVNATLASFCLFIGLFNPILHPIIGKRILYLRNGGTDKWLKRFPVWSLPFWYGWWVLTGILIYEWGVF